MLRGIFVEEKRFVFFGERGSHRKKNKHALCKPPTLLSIY